MTFSGPSGVSYDFDVLRRHNEYTIGALNQSDLDRNLSLPASSLFKWMQAARMNLPWMQAGYTAFKELHPRKDRRLVVGSQILKLAKPGILAEAVHKAVTVRVEIGDIGRTSIEFRVKILFGEVEAASGSTLMICVAGPPGKFKADAVPRDITALAATDGGFCLKLMRDTLAVISRDPPPDSYTSEVVVRYSDEDVNKHANHSAQARFFEDVKAIIMHDEQASGTLRGIASQHFDTMVISYIAEVRAMDLLQIHVAAVENSGLNLWVYRKHPKIALVARGQMLCPGARKDAAEPWEPSPKL